MAIPKHIYLSPYLSLWSFRIPVLPLPVPFLQHYKYVCFLLIRNLDFLGRCIRCLFLYLCLDQFDFLNFRPVYSLSSFSCLWF